MAFVSGPPVSQDVDYHHFSLVGGTVELEAPNGLVLDLADETQINTGIAMGSVLLWVEELDGPPEHFDLDLWDDVVEVSVHVADPAVGLVPLCGMSGGSSAPITTHLDGIVRLRVACWGRDLDYDGISHGIEKFLVLAWPAPPQSSWILKATDAVGRSWRTPRPARAPRPAPRVTDPRQEALSANLLAAAERARAQRQAETDAQAAGTGPATEQSSRP